MRCEPGGGSHCRLYFAFESRGSSQRCQHNSYGCPQCKEGFLSTGETVGEPEVEYQDIVPYVCPPSETPMTGRTHHISSAALTPQSIPPPRLEQRSANHIPKMAPKIAPMNPAASGDDPRTTPPHTPPIRPTTSPRATVGQAPPEKAENLRVPRTQTISEMTGLHSAPPEGQWFERCAREENFERPRHQDTDFSAQSPVALLHRSHATSARREAQRI